MAKKLNGIPNETQRDNRKLRNMESAKTTRERPSRPFLVSRFRRLLSISRKFLETISSTPRFLLLKSSI